jgi:diguanylate cyclase (GGDEF)-like protein
MNSILSLRIHIPLASFIGALAVSALIGGAAGSLVGWPGMIIAAIAASAAGLAWQKIQTIFEARKKPGSPESPESIDVAEAKEISPDRVDLLTGLANMNGLNAWFLEKSARLAQDNKAIIVLAADLADFDQLIKAKGEEKANAVIKEVAKRVMPFAGEDGIAARIEGDEFAAIATVVPNHSQELAAEMAGKLTEMIQRPVELPDGVVWIGGSVGAATGNPPEGLAVFERAKQALKRAKQLGRGHYFVDALALKKD